MNEIIVYTNAEFGSVRMIEVNGEPYFVGKDVAEILGYSNARKAIIDHVDEEDKIDGVTIRDSIGRAQAPICINESGLYSLILSSKLPQAKKFKRWVTSEVLPSIRKKGYYDVKELTAQITAAVTAEIMRQTAPAKPYNEEQSEPMVRYLRYAHQLPEHIRAAVDCMADNNIRLGAILDFLDDNNVWLPRRELVKYIRKRKGDTNG